MGGLALKQVIRGYEGDTQEVMVGNMKPGDTDVEVITF